MLDLWHKWAIKESNVQPNGKHISRWQIEIFPASTAYFMLKSSCVFREGDTQKGLEDGDKSF